MKRKLVSIILVGALVASMGALAGCDNSSSETKEEEADKEEETADTEEEKAEETEAEGEEKEEESDEEKDEPEAEAEAEESDHTTVTIYAAASLQNVMEDLISVYNESEPDVEIAGNYDSSDSLLTQIEEADGDGIDIFFSAAQSQMDTLQEEHLVVDDTRYNVVNNEVCVITYIDSGTEVTDLETLDLAASLALADGSVPVGEYTRQAMVNADMLPEREDVSTITTQEISDALGGVEINECGSDSEVLQAVAEQSDQVGTAYYSDIYGYEDQVEILQVISDELTGDVIYPIAQVVNSGADEQESEAALDFINFITSDAAKDIFVEYYFDVDVTDD